MCQVSIPSEIKHRNMKYNILFTHLYIFHGFNTSLKLFRSIRIQCWVPLVIFRSLVSRSMNIFLWPVDSRENQISCLKNGSRTSDHQDLQHFHVFIFWSFLFDCQIWILFSLKIQILESMGFEIPWFYCWNHFSKPVKQRNYHFNGDLFRVFLAFCSFYSIFFHFNFSCFILSLYILQTLKLFLNRFMSYSPIT